MSLRKLRFSVFVIKTYSGTGKRDFNLGLCFCFFRFCSLPRALTSALIGVDCSKSGGSIIYRDLLKITIYDKAFIWANHRFANIKLQGVPKVIVQRFGLIARPVIM